MTDQPERARRGRFVLHRTDHGWYYNLHAANGEVLVTSETFETKAGAENGYRSVMQNAPTATVEEPED